MSLGDAVLEVVMEMERMASVIRGEGQLTVSVDTFESAARSLRLAVTAADGTLVQKFAEKVGAQSRDVDPITRQLMDRERRRLQHQADEEGLKAQRAETGAGYAVFVGGPLDGTSTEIDANMPPGAKMGLGGGVYVLSGDRRTLAYSEEETAKHLGRFAKAQEGKL